MTNEDVLDVAIIGAGPAGLTAGMYAARAGLKSAMIEKLSFGGQMAQTEHLENYPGYITSTSGYDLAEVMHEQATKFGSETIYDEVVSIDFDAKPFKINLAFGEAYAKTIILATGSRPAKLGLPEEEDLIGSGISYCATCDGNFYKDKVVVVVGGGDTAAADSIYLSRICKKVYMVVRRDELRATAIYHSRLDEIENVEIVWNTVVEKIDSEDGFVSGVEIHNKVINKNDHIDCSAVFIAIGSVPNIEFLNNAIELDSAGYIVAGEMCNTSIPGVYAAGDVRSKVLRQVTTAVADGANAVESADEHLLTYE